VLPASLDEEAFNRLPEVGAAPDFINDDLPSNTDYLDASFGAAAGLRAYDDDDLESLADSDVIPNISTAVSDKGVISKVGGETIKMLVTQGIKTVENFFDSLPALSEERSR